MQLYVASKIFPPSTIFLFFFLTSLYLFISKYTTKMRTFIRGVFDK